MVQERWLCPHDENDPQRGVRRGVEEEKASARGGRAAWAPQSSPDREALLNFFYRWACFARWQRGPFARRPPLEKLVDLVAAGSLAPQLVEDGPE